MADPIPFTPEMKEGWVVRCPHPRFGDAWWYGPDRGWGTTQGRLDDSVPVFPTKRSAQVALRSVFGEVRAAQNVVERVADSLTRAVEQARRRLAETERENVREACAEYLRYLTGDDGQEAPHG